MKEETMEELENNGAVRRTDHHEGWRKLAVNCVVPPRSARLRD